MLVKLLIWTISVISLLNIEIGLTSSGVVIVDLPVEPASQNREILRNDDSDSRRRGENGRTVRKRDLSYERES